MKKIAIAVCYFFKENNYIKNESCIPLQLGFDETKIDLGIQKDIIGETRSCKHPLYSEYSGVYWLWKNVNAEYKGMLHHRRFFTERNKSFSFLCLRRMKNIYNRLRSVIKPYPFGWNQMIECNNDVLYNKMANEFIENINNAIEKVDIIVPKPIHYYITTVKTHFDQYIGRDLLQTTRVVLKENHPEYYYIFEDCLCGNILYYANLEIMKNNLFDEYCNFVFSTFDSIEEKLVSSGLYIDPIKEKSLSRSFGYIGELLTSTFIMDKKINKYKIKECTLLFNNCSKGNENFNDYSRL